MVPKPPCNGQAGFRTVTRLFLARFQESAYEPGVSATGPKSISTSPGTARLGTELDKMALKGKGPSPT